MSGQHVPGTDELGRLLPGSVRGWGASWWISEQGVTPDALKAMTPQQRIDLLDRYWEAEGAGWEPPVPREDWVGPHHPSDPSED